MNQLEGHQTGKWLLVPFLLIVRNTGGPKTRVTGQGREAGSGELLPLPHPHASPSSAGSWARSTSHSLVETNFYKGK